MQHNNIPVPEDPASAFRKEFESEAVGLIKKGEHPYEALAQARENARSHIQIDGENPALKNYSLLYELLGNYDPAIVDRSLSPNDTMKGDNYFSVGVSAVEVILSAIFVSKLKNVEKVLDLPCGHGRVLRHLVPLFPNAQIDACDLDKEGVEFCASTFNVRPILSRDELSEVKFDTAYDLIWIGSLFTHTSYATTKRWLTFLAGQLSSTGIIVSTHHGRWATQLHRLVPYIDEKKWKSIIKGYESNGYGYDDYDVGQRHSFISGKYGVSVAKPHTIIDLVEQIPGVRIYMYQEKAWGDNHDVLVIGRPDWDESWW